MLAVEVVAERDDRVQAVVAAVQLQDDEHPVAGAVDREVARLKLATLGVEIDTLTGEQERYLRPFR